MTSKKYTIESTKKRKHTKIEVILSWFGPLLENTINNNMQIGSISCRHQTTTWKHEKRNGVGSREEKNGKESNNES